MCKSKLNILYVCHILLLIMMMVNNFFSTYQCQEKLTQSLTEEQREDLGPTDLLFKALNNP